MVAEMRCVTSIYRLELGSGSKQEWYLGLSVVGEPTVLPMHYYNYGEVNVQNNWIF